jgi:peptide/nickel transport system permease protein
MAEGLKRFAANRIALFGLVLIAVIVGAALFAPWLAPYPPNEQFFEGLTLEGAPLPPNAEFWLGTDQLGRDLLSRLIYGARTSLVVGVLANGVAVLLGTVLGVMIFTRYGGHHC